MPEDSVSLRNQETGQSFVRLAAVVVDLARSAQALVVAPGVKDLSFLGLFKLESDVVATTSSTEAFSASTG